MKQAFDINKIDQFDSIVLEHLTYEANDTEMLLSCKIEHKGKLYHTFYTVNFSALNSLINVFMKQGIDFYDSLTDRLFNSTERFREFNFTQQLGNRAQLFPNHLAA
jgi:hypothetical protein